MILNAHQAAGWPAAPPTHCLLTLEDWELQETAGNSRVQDSLLPQLPGLRFQTHTF